MAAHCRSTPLLVNVTKALPMMIACIAAHPEMAVAQDYPTRFVRMVVAYAPGGATDLIARQLAPEMATAIGQPVVVDNRAGGNGAIGTDFVSKSAPEGYNVLVGGLQSNILQPLLDPKLPYKMADFSLIGHICTLEQLVVAGPKFPANSIPELIALAKSRPNQLTYATAGIGSGQHLSFEYLGRLSGITMLHVPYKGAGPIITDVIAGHIDLTMQAIPPAVPLVKSGKMKAIAVGNLQRSKIFPNVPTISENGIPGYDAGTWNILMSAPNTPAPIIDRLNSALNAGLKVKKVQDWLAEQGAVPTGGSAAQSVDFFRKETDKWSKIIQQAKVKLD